MTALLERFAFRLIDVCVKVSFVSTCLREKLSGKSAGILG